MHFYYNTKNKNRQNVENMKENNDFIFVMRNKAHSKRVCKWIVNSEATKHMTLYIRATFDIYEIIASCNMHLNDNSVVKAIKIKSIVVEAITRGKLIEFVSKMRFTCPSDKLIYSR